MQPSTSPVTITTEDLPILDTACALILQHIRVCNVCQLSISAEERAVALVCLRTIWNNISLIRDQVHLNFKLSPLGLSSTQQQKREVILNLQSQLWRQLTFPHDTEVRYFTYRVILTLESIILLLSTNTFPELKLPRTYSDQPSVLQQIIFCPIKILDPYISALRRNYYYPISLEPAMVGEHENTGTPEAEEESTMQIDGKPSAQSSTKEKAPLSEVITVEHSLSVITDLIKEIESEGVPTQTQLEAIEETPARPVKASSYRHRFALYRKNPQYKSTLSQLNLFQSFTKCLKATDNTAQILPIRSDEKIHALTTTDQINHLEPIGLQTYFKPYRKTQLHISGDYYIASKLSFQDLQEHKNVQTWLVQHGYGMLWSNCQTSDMVKIGFLSRVRTFTFRDDLQKHITSSPEWKAAPFQFRIYFDSFNAKTKSAHVLMIDVERPKIEVGLQFFQTWYNGKLKNSPNCIEYLFLPLYKKFYTDDERLQIIADHHHHIGNDSVVALKGLKPLDDIVQLVNGVHTTIRKLLLSLPAANTIPGKLFIQIERQPVENWLLCCFYSSDTAKITNKLASLQESLKKFVSPHSWSDLFTDENGIMFSGKAAHLTRNKKNKMVFQEQSPQTAAYVNQSFQTLYTPKTKRPATDMEEQPPEQAVVTPAGKATSSVSYAMVVAPQQQPNQVAVVTPPAITNTAVTSIIAQTPVASQKITSFQYKPLAEDEAFKELAAISNQHSSALLELRECCASLCVSQKKMSDEIVAMNKTFNEKFDIMTHRMDDMSETLNSLKHSPTRGSKQRKELHSLPDIALYGTS
jgi:hypothetical protein